MGIICSYCCSDEDVLSSEEVKKHQDLKGREPLPLCKPCIQLKIAAPLKPGRATNCKQKRRQRRSNIKKLSAKGGEKANKEEEQVIGKLIYFRIH